MFGFSREHFHRHGHGHHHPFFHRMHGFGGPMRRLHWVFRELDLTREQERALTDALETWREYAGTLRKTLREKRREVALLVRGETFDLERAESIEREIETAARAVGSETTALLAKAHGVLNPRQRERVADLLEFGPRGFRRW